MSLPKTTDKKEVYFKKRKQAVYAGGCRHDGLDSPAYGLFPDWGGCA